MKRTLLFLSIIYGFTSSAQCPITVNGQPSGGTFTTCAGTCFVLTASGATTYTWNTGVNTPSATLCPTSTASYTVYGTNGSCTDNNVFTVYVNPNPTITVSAPNSGICPGTTASLCASGAQTYTWSPAYGLSYTSGACPVTTTTNSITYTVCGDVAGCATCTSVAVMVNSSPSVTFTMSNSAPQVWDAVPTYAGGSGPYIYDWDWGDGSAHATTAYPSHTYTAAAWYNVCVAVTDANGCVANYCELDSLYRMSSTMISLNVVSGSSGIQSTINRSTSFYPNPAANQVTVESGVGVAQIFDLTGKMIMSRAVAGKTILDVSMLDGGIYFIKIKATDGTLARKLVVSR